MKKSEAQLDKRSYDLMTQTSESRSVMSSSLRSHGLYSPWNSPGWNTGVVAFPFSRGSSQPRDQTQVSHTAGRFFTNRTIREAQTTRTQTGVSKLFDPFLGQKFKKLRIELLLKETHVPQCSSQHCL